MISRRELLVAVPVLGLAACSHDPAPSFPAFRFEGTPLLFNLADISIDNRFSPLGEGHIEADFDVSPETALENWVGDRLQAAGSSGRLVVTVTDASAVQERLSTTNGVEGLFRDEQGFKITVRLGVDFVADDPGRLSTARTHVEVETFKTLAKDVSFTERRQAYYSLSRGLIDDFDAKAVPALRQHFRLFLG